MEKGIKCRTREEAQGPFANFYALTFLAGFSLVLLEHFNVTLLAEK